ncbi:kelch repeat-containing protein [Planctomycetota bacterium]
MKKTILVALFLVFGLVTEEAKADFIWTQKADMPTPRWGHTSAVVNGKIYVIGGGPSEPSEPNNIFFSAVEEYDPVTDTWTRKADMPTARGWMSPSSAVVNGKIYVIGGDVAIVDGLFFLPIPTVEEYDPAKDTWTRKADMPTIRDCLATVAVDGKIYAIGGYPANYINEGLKTVEEYDPATDTWTKKADMPLGVAMLNARVVKGKIYAVGGRPDRKSRTYMQEYDPATDTWTRKADMLVGTSQMVSVVLGDKIIVIGGWEWSMNYPYQAVQIYDPQTDIWTREADVPFLRAVFSAEVLRGRIFAIGGTDRPHPCPATSTVYECDTGFIPYLADFNGDSIINSEDMCIMIDHWGEDYPLCDIGPWPWGDGIVDVQDLIVLAEHLFEEVDDQALIAHWALDETEGMFAADSVGKNDAFVVGGAVWQPGSGQVDGALEFNGVDCCAIASPVLNPAGGSFSIFTWVKDGGPGQVIVSQQVASDWLAMDDKGNLMTELKSSDQLAGPLLSETVITDGQWHRIGLIWDGSHRTLYVDGVAVSEDTQPGLESSQMGLYIGVDKNYAAGTFFSGLIDDIRIYNRVVNP